MSNDAIITLPEYANNPFIGCLPPPAPRKTILERIRRLAAYDESERLYPAYLRKHCLMRLKRYHEPMEHQVLLAEQIDMMLRQGYIGRDPSTKRYIHHLQNGALRVEARDINCKILNPAESTAVSLALVGCSGVGKSTSIMRILSQYPQVVHHSSPFSLVQIVWLQLPSPITGGAKQLCISFFSAVDALIGTNYFQLYGGGGIDAMLANMTQVATLHAIGLLVIDEIQHLRSVVNGPETVMNLLVTLVNVISVPVIVVGTPGATSIIQKNFRQARRASGLGSPVWNPLTLGVQWDYFLGKLWKLQWTHEFTSLTPEISLAIHTITQGIPDIAVTLFMLAQMRVISIAEARNRPEVLSEKLLAKIADAEFTMIKPMLVALRTGDEKALMRYDDLTLFREHTDDIFSRWTATHTLFVSQAPSEPQPAASTNPPEMNCDEKVFNVLRNLNVADDVAKQLVARANAESPGLDPVAKTAQVVGWLSGKKEKRPSQRPQKTEKPIDFPADDLRAIIKEGKKAGLDAYQAMESANLIATFFSHAE
jgi:hypothetical protein